MSAPTNANAGVAPGATHDTEQQASPKTTATPEAAQAASVKRGRGRPPGSKNKPKATTTQAPPRPWREVLKVHPACDAYPMMGADESRQLVDDIRKHHLREMVDFWRDPVTGERWLMDGRNRLDAMEQLGYELFGADGEPKKHYFKEVMENVAFPSCERIPLDAAAFARSKNVFRRHLTPEQRRAFIADELKANPEQSNRAIAKAVGVDHKTVGDVRDDLQSTGEIPQLKKTTGADGKARPAKKQSKPAKPIPPPRTVSMIADEVTTPAPHRPTPIAKAHVSDADEVQAIVDQVRVNVADIDLVHILLECIKELHKRPRLQKKVEHIASYLSQLTSALYKVTK